jgi:hypothetical protein
MTSTLTPVAEYEVEVTEEKLQEVLNKFVEGRKKLLTGQSLKISIGKIAEADLVFVLRPAIPLFGEHMERHRKVGPQPPTRELAN